MDADKDSLTATAKPTASEGKQNSFNTSRGQAAVQPPPEKQGSFTCNGDLGRLMLSLWMSPLSLPPSQVYVLSMAPHGLEYPLGPFGSAVLPVSPLSLLTPCLLTREVGWEAEKTLTLYKFSSYKNISVLSALLPVRVQSIALYQMLWIKFYLSQPKPACTHSLQEYI